MEGEEFFCEGGDCGGEGGFGGGVVGYEGEGGVG